MTNREALEVIERLGVDSRGYPKLKEAIDMAIEALQQGCEKVAEGCDDLISREQALDAIHDWKPSDVFDEFNPTTAFTIICALPSANPDLSGFCDRLWRSAYNRGYERCKDDAIDALQKEINKGIPPFNDTGIRCGVRFAMSIIENLPPRIQTEPIPELLDDGTLVIPVPNGMLNGVKRVMVDEVGTKFCKVMYDD